LFTHLYGILSSAVNAPLSSIDILVGEIFFRLIIMMGSRWPSDPGSRCSVSMHIALYWMMNYSRSGLNRGLNRGLGLDKQPSGRKRDGLPFKIVTSQGYEVSCVSIVSKSRITPWSGILANTLPHVFFISLPTICVIELNINRHVDTKHLWFDIWISVDDCLYCSSLCSFNVSFMPLFDICIPERASTSATSFVQEMVIIA
jgi:hypothetical protein